MYRLDPNKTCTPSGNPDKDLAGVGMPQALYLQMFGDIVRQAFGEFPYHVGSSLTGKVWRDVDVRVMLDDKRYEAEYGDPMRQHQNPKWGAICMAFSALGSKMTGLPIDFQVQDTTTTNVKYPGQRSALILCEIRRQHPNRPI